MTATTTDPRAKLPETPLSGNEALKERSDYLHGTIKEELKDDFTGGFTADNFQLIASTVCTNRTTAISVPSVPNKNLSL